MIEIDAVVKTKMAPFAAQNNPRSALLRSDIASRFHCRRLLNYRDSRAREESSLTRDRGLLGVH